MSKEARRLNDRGRQRHNRNCAMRLRGRAESRSRSRNRNGNDANHNNAHQGRDLRVVEAPLIQNRIEQYPDQSFACVKGRLWCQACNKAIKEKASTVKRHLGLSNASVYLCVPSIVIFVFLLIL